MATILQVRQTQGGRRKRHEAGGAHLLFDALRLSRCRQGSGAVCCTGATLSHFKLLLHLSARKSWLAPQRGYGPSQQHHERKQDTAETQQRLTMARCSQKDAVWDEPAAAAQRESRSTMVNGSGKIANLKYVINRSCKGSSILDMTS